MPMTFFAKNNYLHRKTCTCSQNNLLCLVKFAESGYYVFFSQLIFKIMKVVSLKLVTNMFRDLCSKCASEYP